MKQLGTAVSQHFVSGGKSSTSLQHVMQIKSSLRLRYTFKWAGRHTSTTLECASHLPNLGENISIVSQFASEFLGPKKLICLCCFGMNVWPLRSWEVTQASAQHAGTSHTSAAFRMWVNKDLTEDWLDRKEACLTRPTGFTCPWFKTIKGIAVTLHQTRMFRFRARANAEKEFSIYWTNKYGISAHLRFKNCPRRKKMKGDRQRFAHLQGRDSS